MSGGPSRRLFSLPLRRRLSPGAANPARDAEPAVARWRAARLAWLATALGRLSHDLRGVLSPALLAGERLQAHSDPAVRRSADVLVRAVDRAIATLRDDLGPIRAMLPEVARTPLPLRQIIDAAMRPDLPVVNTVPPDSMAEADPTCLRQAWECLFAHLRSRQARRATVSATRAGRSWTITVDHDGTPEPEVDPFAPLDAGGPFDLATARDLIRACGGELAIEGRAKLVVTL